VLNGKVPAPVHAVRVTETVVDAQGKVLDVQVLRPPAEADAVTPWVAELIRQAAPLPPPLNLRGARDVAVWLVDRSGRFQVDSLTERQF
jgi:periplasmic protein TonB